MAFKIHKIDDGHIPGIEYLPAGAITPKVGMALYQSSGNLAIATGTTVPTYISMCEKATACTAGDLIPVIRVREICHPLRRKSKTPTTRQRTYWER